MRKKRWKPNDVSRAAHEEEEARKISRDPEKARERIFHLYYTTKPGGNGIGLAQAFRAVQLHDGRITFDSQPGQGTAFNIRLKAVMSDE